MGRHSTATISLYRPRALHQCLQEQQQTPVVPGGTTGPYGYIMLQIISICLFPGPLKNDQRFCALAKSLMHTNKALSILHIPRASATPNGSL